MWRLCSGNKVLYLPAGSLCDFPPAQMIKIPESDVGKKHQNHLYDSFKHVKPMHDDKAPVAVRIIDDAIAVAGMPFYISDDKVWIREAFDFDHADLTYHLHFLFRLPISRFYCELENRGITLSIRYSQAGRTIDAGISLLPAINNYWHFMFEQAPKIMLANMAGIPDDVPLLLPDNLHKNLYEMVDLLNQGKREIIYLPTLEDNEIYFSKINKIIKIKKLYHIADVINIPTYDRLDSRGANDNPYQMQCNVMRLLRKQLLDACNVTLQSDKKVKLFIFRASSYRIAKDQEQLKQYFLEKGWTVFQPEKHSFIEQIKICSRASAIASYSGAAWSNVLFVPTDAKKVLFTNLDGKIYVSIWDLLCQNFYALQNDYTPQYEGDTHGTPYFNEQNWQDLEEIIAKT